MYNLQFIQVCRQVSSEMLRNVRKAFKTRLYHCVKTKFEHIIK